MISEQILHEAEEAIFSPAEQYMEKWQEEIDAVLEAKPDMDDFQKATLAICLENTDKWLSRMDEVTRTVNVGSFIHHGFELIAAVLPSLIAQEIISVQPQTRRIGEIFFLEFLYGTTRGNITQGQKMFSAEAAGNAQTIYTSSEGIEENIGTGAPPQQTFSGNINTVPIVAGSFSVTDTNEVFTDNGTGTLTGSLGGTGTINYNTGAFVVNFFTAPVLNQVIVATYDIDFEQNPGLIPQADITITSSPTVAKDRMMRAQYSLGSAFDMESAFGRSADAELKAATAAEIRQEIDGDILKQLVSQASSTGYNWSKTPPSPTIPWSEHKWSFYDLAIIPSSNSIFSNTRRAMANFIVGGIDVCNVIESLAPQFRAEGVLQPGPHYIGTLGSGLRVYKNPFFAPGQYLVGYKGNMFIEAGFVWAPYMPMYTTRTVVLDDNRARFGLIQSAAKKMVNSLFYAQASVTP